MCGLICVYTRESGLRDSCARYLRDELSVRMVERGPDSYSTLGLGNSVMAHSRLAIVDDSNTGAQPVAVANRYLISFNGEIYNWQLLAKKLFPDRNINGDTHLLVNCLADGLSLPDIAKNIDGMFAIVVHDRILERTYLLTDQYSKKPLFYLFRGGTFICSSELRVVIDIAQSQFRISLPKDDSAMVEYYRYGNISAGRTIYSNVHLVLPNTLTTIDHVSLTLNISSPDDKTQVSETCFGDDHGSFADNFRTAVSKRIPDGPFGLFLSSGVDSSAVATFASDLVRDKNDVLGVTSKLDNSEMDESSGAMQIASALGVRCDVVDVADYYREQSVQAVLEKLYEPCGDSSILSVIALSSHLRQHGIKVALTGDGGDEIGGGYRRHIYIKRLEMLRQITRSVGLDRFNGIFSNVADGNMLVKAKFYSTHSLSEIYNILTGSNDYLRLFKADFRHDRDLPERIPYAKSEVQQIMDADLYQYVVLDILQKVDRGTMLHSVEARSPFLDTALVRRSRRIDISKKIDFFRQKKIIHSILDPSVRRIVSKKKKGFVSPYRALISGALFGSVVDKFLDSPHAYFLQSKDEFRRKISYSNFLRSSDPFYWNLISLSLSGAFKS